MAKSIPEDKMDELMKILSDGLNGIFGDIANVKCIKGNSNELIGHMMETYMDYPIIKLTVSRDGSDVSVSKCCIEDVIQVLPNAIGSLLGLIPSEYRNDVLYKAITTTDMTDNGGLRDKLDEKDDE